MDKQLFYSDSLSILNCLKEKIPDILVNRPVNLAYLYGSLADGQALPLSDVDLALVLRPDPSFSAYDRIRMEFEIAAEVESQCAISPVDVRSMNDAPLPVRGMVVTEGILLFSRDEEFRIDFEVYTRKLYFDFLPTQEMMRQAFFESLKKEGLLGDKTR